MDGNKLALSIKNAAHILSLSPWTLRRWIRLGQLKAVRLGRRVLVEPEELERLIASGRKTRKLAPPNTLFDLSRHPE